MCEHKYYVDGSEFVPGVHTVCKGEKGPIDEIMMVVPKSNPVRGDICGVCGQVFGEEEGVTSIEFINIRALMYSFQLLV